MKMSKRLLREWIREMLLEADPVNRPQNTGSSYSGWADEVKKITKRGGKKVGPGEIAISLSLVGITDIKSLGLDPAMARLLSSDQVKDLVVDAAVEHFVQGEASSYDIKIDAASIEGFNTGVREGINKLLETPMSPWVFPASSGVTAPTLPDTWNPITAPLNIKMEVKAPDKSRQINAATKGVEAMAPIYLEFVKFALELQGAYEALQSAMGDDPDPLNWEAGEGIEALLQALRAIPKKESQTAMETRIRAVTEPHSRERKEALAAAVPQVRPNKRSILRLVTAGELAKGTMFELQKLATDLNTAGATLGPKGGSAREKCVVMLPSGRKVEKSWAEVRAWSEEDYQAHTVKCPLPENVNPAVREFYNSLKHEFHDDPSEIKTKFTQMADPIAAFVGVPTLGLHYEDGWTQADATRDLEFKRVSRNAPKFEVLVGGLSPDKEAAESETAEAQATAEKILSAGLSRKSAEERLLESKEYRLCEPIEERILRETIREALLSEELTKTDKNETTKITNNHRAHI